MKLKKQEQTETAERLAEQKLIKPKELTEALQERADKRYQSDKRSLQEKANVVAVTTSRVVHR